ncbi:MAG TPA: D-2-hydroxyacid dehydrogenase family protein [Chloroflexota bacterium]|jgi:phosphoglycerate dehydrogenase-like enzyme
MAYRIAVLDDYQHVARRFGPWDQLPAGSELVVFHDHLVDEDAVVERLRPFDVVVAMRERTSFPRSVLERLPSLRLLVTTGMGNAAIDLPAARERSIVVSGTGGVAPATAELTWGLILALARHIAEEDSNVRANRWQQTVGVDLAGRTLGVIGLGNLGKRVATVGLAFGMEVVAWSQNLSPDTATALGVRPVSKEELLRGADIVTIHLRLSDRTRGLLGDTDLRLLKPTALLVNTSRGPIVDEAALLAALHEGRLAGAGLDVYDVEPLPADHPLRRAPRTVLTPHLGYVTDGTYGVFYRDAVEDIVAFSRGVPVRVL